MREGGQRLQPQSRGQMPSELAKPCWGCAGAAVSCPPLQGPANVGGSRLTGPMRQGSSGWLTAAPLMAGGGKLWEFQVSKSPQSGTSRKLVFLT